MGNSSNQEVKNCGTPAGVLEFWGDAIPRVFRRRGYGGAIPAGIGPDAACPWDRACYPGLGNWGLGLL